MPGFLIAIPVYIISFLVPRTVPDTDLEIRGGAISEKIFLGPSGLSLV